ncbi:hypothetical protein Pmar_PMAR004705 [Perkinsus marinus ATCC 50983]|uniref:Uncharacterized protein n=1 Tax=Perkinsus marinus (strain ATCC 50983 / TXsc) TaxID=423536 RepID=C5KF51_PERM5|nr:hypothetical protein Pmar_PMAR004705 [Perkinsus marinus ATCC 50983]EER16853.1 hypothetical protein Pmar_PMAR004705 [Perkinsus marinus ATCC 50983]|eukprot:XP_002785057.1 hypothetical protein Pmar_PMAR004705 [Perkinsus marinus ATCC 50983]
MSNVSASAKRRARAKNTKERLFAGAVLRLAINICNCVYYALQNDAEGHRSKPEDRCGQLKETRVQTASEDCEQEMQKLKVQLQRASDIVDFR